MQQIIDTWQTKFGKQGVTVEELLSDSSMNDAFEQYLGRQATPRRAGNSLKRFARQGLVIKGRRTTSGMVWKLAS